MANTWQEGRAARRAPPEARRRRPLVKKPLRLTGRPGRRIWRVSNCRSPTPSTSGSRPTTPRIRTPITRRSRNCGHLTGAPNVLIVLIDDVGFGASSAFGGPCNTPVAERLAANGIKLNRFHTTALCSPTRQAMLTGRNHHSVGMGAITEMATSAPGNNSIRPKEKAPIAETLKLNGYSTAQFGKCHEVPVWEVSPAGPFHQWPTGSGFEYFYGFIGGEANQYYPGCTKAPRQSSRRSRPRRATRSPRISLTARSPGCGSRRR